MSKLFLALAMAAATGFGASPDFPETIPTEAGMYQRDRSGHWEEIEALVFNTKTGGVVKSLVTLGIIKPDTNANLWQRSSIYSASYQDEFLVVVPEGVSIGEYQMIHLHQQKTAREFRMQTGGIFHASSGSHRDNQEFTSKKVAPHTYVVRFQTYQGGGQFGFLPPPSFNPTPYAFGRIYCFEMRN